MKSILIILSFAFSCLCVRAAKFDVGQLAKLVNVSDPQISPDGKSVVIVVSRPDYDLNVYRSELVLVDVATHKQRVLTHDRKGVGYPRWSRSGDRLAFLAHDSNDKPQLFAMPMMGGDAEQLTKAATGVQQYRWRPDGEAMLTLRATSRPKKRDPKSLRTL